ncbi:hypothetical protein [Maridesulfovibrio salexigens]|uniref:Uncharacterized protein n=1 Tax=Maridesulfovibrio salexigens (strain ATCC 14822 / DSM 2638 / NCIMB 8403 / VKM B-1763) TaxID=526222 RepID=C6C0F9_MARSD|nr:hypothetical protein [Maridesulfovibrio salexigens]ACS79093.1 hypothetical protein Desal_1028 [Maridesulfovibrio salexigens DSM 2638]
MKLLLEFLSVYVKKNLVIFTPFLVYSISCFLLPDEWYSYGIIHSLVTAFVLSFAENIDDMRIGKIGSFINKTIMVCLVFFLLSSVSSWLGSFLASAFGAYRAWTDVMAGTVAPYSPKELLCIDGMRTFVESIIFSACSLLFYVPARVEYEEIKSVKMSFVRLPINFVVLFLFGFTLFGLKYLFDMSGEQVWFAVCSGLYISGLPLLSFTMGRIEYELELKQIYEGQTVNDPQ